MTGDFWTYVTVVSIAAAVLAGLFFRQGRPRTPYPELPDDDDIDLSDIPEQGEEWFQRARIVWPEDLDKDAEIERLKSLVQSQALEIAGLERALEERDARLADRAS